MFTAMKLNPDQIDTLSKYLADVSKILFASTVIGFFVPMGVGPITIPVFMFGFFIALGLLALSMYVHRDI